MVVNASPQYQKAEKEYLLARTIEEKIEKLKAMIRLCPKHKGSEAMLAELRKRLAKLKKELVREREIKKRRGHSINIKKEQDAQVVMLGFTNAGKSTLISRLTNASPEISEYPYTTSKPEVGTLEMGCKIQIIEVPSLKPHGNNKERLSLASTADLILIVVTGINELKELSDELKKYDKKILVINKRDLLTENELRILLNFKNSIAVSAKNDEGIEELKQMIFDNLNIIRIYTKEPGKKPTANPLVLRKGSDIKKVAKRIRGDYVKRFLFARMWGKSAKFPGQKVGISHLLEDNDIIELHLD